MRRHFQRRRLRLAYLLAIGDGVLTLASLAASYGLLSVLGARPVPADLGRKLLLAGLPLAALQVGVLYVFGLHALAKRLLGWRAVASLLLAVGTGALLSSGLLFFTPHFLIGRLILLVHVPLLCSALLAWRLALHHLAIANEPPRRLAIAGSRQAVLDFISDLGNEELSDYAVAKAHVAPPSQVRVAEPDFDKRGIEWCSDLDKLMGAYDYQALALDMQEFGTDERIAQRVIEVSFAGIPIHDLATLHKDLTGCYPSGADGRSIVAAVATRVGQGGYYGRAKRLADTLIGTAALLVGAVPMLLIAALIRLESPGPALFVQERIGWRRHPFGCIKFRTMVADAEGTSGPVWAEEDDPRITRVGRFLRATRLDELPQFINVVKGEMTLVGPRPIRAFFADQLARSIPFYDLRFAVKPGLTGWAQVHQRYARSMEEQELKFRYDLFYLENFSVWLDLYTLMKTLRVVVSGRG